MTSLTSWPFTGGGATSEAQFSRLFRELQSTGIADSADGTGFKVTGSGTAMTVSVAAGFAIVRGFACYSAGAETVAIAASESQSRTDIVVLRLTASGVGTHKVDLAVVKGTAGAGVPALTQTDTGDYELPLAYVTVGASVSVIATSAVADKRVFQGRGIDAWTDANKPATGRLGQIAYNVTNQRHEQWNGTQWSALIAQVAWADITGKPSTFPAAVSWTDVTGKPSTFTPSSHTHSWNTDLTDVPATFPPATHSHSWTSITSKPTQFPVEAHTHSATTSITNMGNATVGYANGSERVRDHSPAGSGFYAVWVDGNDNFCHNTSSRRYKENIRSYGVDPASVLALEPKVYDRKDTVDEDGNVVVGAKDEYGLIAEDVEQHVPEIVVYNDEGEVEALRYDLLAVALLDVVKAQDARIAALEARLA